MFSRSSFASTAARSSSWAKIALSLCTVVSAAGCYDKARTGPGRATVPSQVLGQEVEIDLGTTEEAVVYGSRVRWEKDYDIQSMKYGDDRLTYHQVRTLTDPTWEKKIEQHAALVKSCQRANIPRYIGYASVVAGLGVQTYGSFIMGDQAEYQQVAAFGLMGFGALSYLAGYAFLGGRKCSEANQMYADMGLEYANETAVYSDALIAEFGPIILDFNERQRKMEAKASAEAKTTGDEDEDGERDDDDDDDDDDKDEE